MLILLKWDLYGIRPVFRQSKLPSYPSNINIMQTPNTTYKNTEIGSIPVDWEVKELGSFLSLGSGKDYKHLDKGDIPVYGTGGVMTYVNNYLYEGETVGIGRKGTIDKPVFLSGKFWTVDTLFYAHQFVNLNPKFIYYKFCLIKWREYNEASGVPSLNKNTLYKIKFSLPKLTEQTAIANALSDADALINNIEKLITKKRNIKQGAMQKLLQPKEGWEVKKLGEVVTFLDGKRKPIKDSERAKMQGIYPYYGASGIIDFVNDYIFDDELILLGEDGDNILSRSSKLAFQISGKVWINNHAHVLKPNENINITFLTEYLESLDYQLYNSGTAQPKINQKACSNIPILLPSLKTQIEIAQILSDMDLEIAGLEDKLSKYRAIKTGMMQNLLTGKIRLV